MLTRQLIAALDEHMNGRALAPEDPAYEEARAVWNAMIDRKPAAIAVCRTADDVIHAVNAARSAGLAVSVRGGGHNIAGTAVADGAMMIDLSPMRRVEVDAAKRIATVEGGATLADMDRATQAHGLAAPGGVVSSTGVAGLTLGGGFGWLSRRFGLAADNLVAVDMVLADGTVARASADENRDLFWAVRGGSGNFGVATGFAFRLHDVGPEVLFGPTIHRIDAAEAVLRHYREFAAAAPREACVWADLMTAPPLPILPEDVHGAKVLTLMQCYSGDPDEGQAVLQPLRGFGEPVGDGVMRRPFAEAQGFLDDAYAKGARNYWSASHHMDLSDALIGDIVDSARKLPSTESDILIAQLGGAIDDVGADATAYPHRGVQFVVTPGARWRDPAGDAAMTGWLRGAASKFARGAVPGKHVNFMSETDRPDEAYGANLQRLSAIKATYDPANLFRANQNVAPGGGD